MILTGNDLNSGIRRHSDKLSASEDNNRKKQIVIDALRKTIQSQEQAIEHRKRRIENLRKEIKDREVVVHDLEEEIKDSELIIKAYEEFLSQEMRQADQDSLEADSMRELIASDEKPELDS